MIPQGWFHEFEKGINAIEVYKRALRLSQKAEDLGFDCIWLVDHFYPLYLSKERLKKPVLECLTLLTSLATTTSKIRIGSMVLCNNYRNPALLAKMASTLDLISNGRLDFGIGAGCYKEEYVAYGYKFHKYKVRVEMLDEAIHVIKLLWTKDKASFQGKYYQIKNAYCYPKPVQKPHPPILIGGGGERYLLKLVAKHADKWNVGISRGIDKAREKLRILRNYFEEVGRNYDSLQKTCRFNVILSDSYEKARRKMKNLEKVLRGDWFSRAFDGGGFVGTPEGCVERMKKIVKLGFEEFVVLCFNDEESYELLANEVKPKLSR